MEFVVRNRNISIVRPSLIKWDPMIVIVYLILVNGDPTAPVGYLSTISILIAAPLHASIGNYKS